MLKWLLTLAIAVLMLGLIAPWLRQHLGARPLPGDVRVRYKGRAYYFPFASTLLFSLLLIGFSRWL
ncbi:MAG: DUF2905 domain-containing protein [Azovibrio sp.]|nr:DUF2905 domain-containing protein [Azovibrio sp.]